MPSFAFAAKGNALETQDENFEIFATFFAAAKVGVERASLTFFRAAMQLGHLDEGMRIFSFAIAGQRNALETQIENFEKFATFFASAKVGVGRACLTFFRLAMQRGYLNEGVRISSFAIAGLRNALETRVEDFARFRKIFASNALV